MAAAPCGAPLCQRSRGPVTDELRRFIRFASVGLLCASLTLAAFTAMIEVGVHYLLAGPVSYAAGILVGFTLNRRWTFHAVHGRAAAQVPRFLTVQAGAVALNAGLLHLLIAGADLPEVPAEILTLALIGPVTFAANRYWTFR